MAADVTPQAQQTAAGSCASSGTFHTLPAEFQPYFSEEPLPPGIASSSPDSPGASISSGPVMTGRPVAPGGEGHPSRGSLDVGSHAVEAALRLAETKRSIPTSEPFVTLSIDWFLALMDEVDRMSHEIMRYQVGESYQVGYEHGVAAAEQRRARRGVAQ